MIRFPVFIRSIEYFPYCCVLQVVVATALSFTLFLMVNPIVDGSKVQILASKDGCAALVEEQRSLPYTGEDAFFLKLDLSVKVPTVMSDSFKEDTDGKDCFERISGAFNSSLDLFYKKVARIETDGHILRTHLKNVNGKRSAGVAVAIAMGIVNAIATAGSFIYDQYQFGLLKARILE